MSESVVVFQMLEHDLDIDEVTQKLLAVITDWLKQEDCYTTDVQQQMLESHLRAMVARAKTGEALPEVDISLFDEISQHSIALAQRVVDTLPGLAPEETYLLSVHFEVVRSND
ncbi:MULTISPECIES: transcriptional antiterminator [Providencia]|jgi:PRD domain protein (TIGR03582 family)|uniref:transcriptional antiterminator n=1 Tax=Providencia TaxID=586 RepID=UPI00197EF9CD|nr:MULTISPECIES: transcriptional antiterminator [Providencia]MDR2225689.1 transcriptional antiterminator [Providencia sp.]ELR5149752.1 transcriptional antiterminator [Providencia rettgeri]MBN4864465.1 transcriptional antiterminator [Providencia stuartii]MBN4874088.1 transcriptional antiterminator [Providencia stuartii]MBN4878779.1 transcriptional antiterminator [Providencia stuartii]